MRIPDQLVKQARERCLADPLSAQTYDALARIERGLHRRGWDSPPQVWRLDYADDGLHSINGSKSHALTAMLRNLHVLACGDMSAALGVLSRCAEMFAGVKPVDDRMSDWLQAYSTALSVQSGRLHGYVFISEGWGVSVGEDAPEETVERLKQAARERRLHEAPERVELRMVTAVCRDGSVWSYYRIKGEQPRPWLLRPGDDMYCLSGGVPHTLARMVAAEVPDHKIDLGPVVTLDSVFPRDRNASH